MPVYLVVIMSCHALHGDTEPASSVHVCVCSVCMDVFSCLSACISMYMQHIRVSFKIIHRTTHVERDVNMKRQLVEDLKTRLKFLQDMEKSYRGQVEDRSGKEG